MACHPPRGSPVHHSLSFVRTQCLQRPYDTCLSSHKTSRGWGKPFCCLKTCSEQPGKFWFVISTCQVGYFGLRKIYGIKKMPLKSDVSQLRFAGLFVCWLAFHSAQFLKSVQFSSVPFKNITAHPQWVCDPFNRVGRGFWKLSSHIGQQRGLHYGHYIIPALNFHLRGLSPNMATTMWLTDILLRVFLQLVSNTALKKQSIRPCFKTIAPVKFVNMSMMGGIFNRKLRIMIPFDW